MIKWIKVKEERFKEFINNYSKLLESNLSRIPEPNIIFYNDFSDGKKFPESVVAKIDLDWMGPNGEVDMVEHGKFYEYYIKGEED